MINHNTIRKAVDRLGWEVTDENEDQEGFWFLAVLRLRDGQKEGKNVHSSWTWVHQVIAAELLHKDCDAIKTISAVVDA